MSNWDEVRKDFNNLTPLNRKEFQLNRFFRNIGKQDHYVIPESDWTKIKHAYTKHSEMGLEETVMPGCFRIVIMDLEVDNGWFSTIVRAEGLNMQTVLTDPKKLLPLLEDPSLEDTWVVKPVELEEVNGGAGLDIEIETVRKLEQALPVIVVKDPVVSQASADLESTINSVNQRLTSQFTKESAVGFCAVPWDVYVCATPEEKRRLHNDLPFLFKDNTETVSFMNACAAITRYNDQGLISSELINFIDARYTTLVNDWLVNCAGYEGRKNAKRHLSVTSAFNDFRALLEFLKERDPETGAYLVESEKVNYLNEQVKIFDFENPYRKGQAEESEIDKLKHELELVVARPMYINVMNKRGGPSHLENDVPIVIKRSKFPEYFKMIEDGFDVTMGDNYMSESTDKLLKFDESGNMWLFSYSIVDRNVATLRFVTRSKHLCLLALS